MISNSLFLSILILIGIGGLILIIGYTIVASAINARKRNERIDSYIRNTEQERTKPKTGKNLISIEQLDEFREWINRTLSSLSSEKLKQKISSAYWPISDIEFILIRFSGVGIGFLFGWLISRTIIGGIGVGALFYFVPNFLLTRTIANRQKAFQEQLIDVLILIRGAVQAGYGLLQSLDVVMSEMTAPASEEFGRVIREVQIGYSLNQALTNLANRVESDDLQLVVTAITINTQVGGNLTTMLTAVTNTIRARYQLFGEVRALTSYARYAGYVLTFLPFGTGLAMYMLSPDTYAQSITSPISQIILGFSLLLIIIGNIWLRQITKIEI